MAEDGLWQGDNNGFKIEKLDFRRLAVPIDSLTLKFGKLFMDSMNPRTVHRKLVVRISVTACIIALLFGFGAWQYEKKDIGEEILLRAENGFKMLNNQIRGFFDDPNAIKPSTIQHKLVQMMSERRIINLGMFV